MEKRGFTRKEAAHYCGVSVSFLAHYHLKDYDGPSFVSGHKKGKTAIYLKEELDRWLDSLESTKVGRSDST